MVSATERWMKPRFEVYIVEHKTPQMQSSSTMYFLLTRVRATAGMSQIMVDVASNQAICVSNKMQNTAKNQKADQNRGFAEAVSITVGMLTKTVSSPEPDKGKLIFVK